MKDQKVFQDVCLLVAIGLITVLGVAIFSRVPTSTYGPHEPVARETGTGLLLIEGEPRIDLNRASAELLQTLDGIGPVLAERIVEFREEHGPFQSIEEIMLVNGIGEKKFEANRERIAVEQLTPSIPWAATTAPDG